MVKKHWKTILILTAALNLALWSAGCGPNDSQDHGHEHGPGEEHDHDHDPGDSDSDSNGGGNGNGDDSAQTPSAMAQQSGAESSAYPLEVCVVSGEKLGSMGEPEEYRHEGQLVKFCCSHCIDDFNESPEKYLQKIAAAR